MKWMTTALTAILVAVCCQVCSAQAPWVEGFYRPVAAGYEVTFTLNNRWSDCGLHRFQVYARDRQAAISVSGPVGWSVWASPECGVRWSSLTAESDVQPNGSMGGFIYTTAVPPETLDWAILFTKGGYRFGKVTPVLVPEPSSIAALGGGVMGLLALRRRRR